MTKPRIFSSKALVFSLLRYLDCSTLLVVTTHTLTPGDLYHVRALVAQEVDKQLLLDLWEPDLFEKQLARSS